MGAPVGLITDMINEVEQINGQSSFAYSANKHLESDNAHLHKIVFQADGVDYTFAYDVFYGVWTYQGER